MTYSTYSSHAFTGESASRTISTNPYSTLGRTIGFPNNLDLYVRYISDSEGSQTVQETRELSHINGSRLYLHHRPLVSSNGTITSIVVSDGTIDSSYTNATQGYIVFSTLPTDTFTVTYSAAPDCDINQGVNCLQDSVMEIEALLGPNNDTTFPGIRNLKLGLFDSPTGVVASGVLTNGVFLSHLDQDIVIASSDDSTLQVSRGDSHVIQLGRETDKVVIDATGFTITETNGSLHTTMIFGSNTGDTISWKGTASGAGPLTIGGPEWSTYSGVVFSAGLTGSFYTGSMLRVHGDVAVMGGIISVGPLVVVETTGSTSTILGDFTVRDELFVNGISHLIGDTEVNSLIANQNIYLEANIIADNTAGAGGNGQSLIDNLDCSEVAHSYNYVIKNRRPNSVIAAPLNTGVVLPVNRVYRPWLDIAGNHLVGDVFAITGQLNAAASSSGVHPHILQLLLNVELVTGFYSSYGTQSGIWSPGMMDPGSMWIRMLDGPAAGMEAPIYSYTVEATGTLNTLTRLNVFLPEEVTNPPQTNNLYLLYNPGTVKYNTISAAGGASPTFSVNASTTFPLAVSFEDEVRIMTTSSASYSLSTALSRSVSGLSLPSTGVAYIFADSNGTDPENPPIFKARPVPIRMPGQTPIGEVVASYDGAIYTILDTVSYRPQGKYDSAWIPIISNTGMVYTSGRCTPGFSTASTSPLRVYFNHNLGSDVEIGNITTDLYLGRIFTDSISWNKTHTPMYSFFGQDSRNSHGLTGTLVHIPIGASRTNSTAGRDASIFYLDSTLIGIDITPGVLSGFFTGSSTSNSCDYLKLIVNKNI